MHTTNWRPTRKMLIEAESLLMTRGSPRCRTRLNIVRAILVNRRSTNQAVAKMAKTRCTVVVSLLNRWHREGKQSLLQFGRPHDLDATAVQELGKAIKTNRMRSLKEVGAWLQESTGIVFTQPSLRSYCRRLGFDLPANIKPETNTTRVQPVRKWTPNQIASLKRYEGPLKNRITAIFRVGTEAAKSVNFIAKDCEVPASTLRLDLKHFMKGGIRMISSHARRINVLRRTDSWESFVEWCNFEKALIGRCPSARSARNFLLSKHRIRMPLRTVYTHLTAWKRYSEVPMRGYRNVEKFVPSQGLEIRGLNKF